MTNEINDPELTEDEKALFESLSAEDKNDFSEAGIQRRLFLKQVIMAGGGVLALQLPGSSNLFAGSHTALEEMPAPGVENSLRVAFRVNGLNKSLEIDSRTTLLDALREKLGLTGSKKGCDHGQCGACTVIADGKRVLSCLTLAASCEGKSIFTIEGLAKGGELHPMQSAFLKHDGFQCGYCTPGQICSAVALMKEAKNGEVSYVTQDIRSGSGAVELSMEEIKERMSGNICRCGAYPNIVAAIQEVHTGKNVAQSWQFIEENKNAT